MFFSLKKDNIIIMIIYLIYLFNNFDVIFYRKPKLSKTVYVLLGLLHFLKILYKQTICSSIE